MDKGKHYWFTSQKLYSSYSTVPTTDYNHIGLQCGCQFRTGGFGYYDLGHHRKQLSEFLKKCINRDGERKISLPRIVVCDNQTFLSLKMIQMFSRRYVIIS